MVAVRHDACNALVVGYKEIQNALSELSIDHRQMPSTRHEASCLVKKLSKPETALLVNDIFSKVLKLLVSHCKSGKRPRHCCTHLLFTGRVFQIWLTDLMISIFKRPSCVGRTQNMKKTTKDVDVAKTMWWSFRRFRWWKTANACWLFQCDIQCDYWRRRCRAKHAKASLCHVEVSKMFGFLWRLHYMDINAIAQRSDELVSGHSGDLDTTLTDECLQLRHYIAQSGSQQLVSNLNLSLYAWNCHLNSLHQRFLLIQRCECFFACQLRTVLVNVPFQRSSE